MLRIRVRVLLMWAQTGPGVIPLPINMDVSYVLPSIYSYPPFFSRQPNAQTYAAQKSAWANLILGYYRSKRLWRIDVNQETIEKVPIFSNKGISRKIKLEFLRELVDGMVEDSQAEWVGKGVRVQALLYWNKPEEWANMISNWIDETGQKNAVLTLYELSQGDLVMTEEFREMDPVLLKKVLQILVKRGVATIFKGADGEETGVKFFGSS